MMRHVLTVMLGLTIGVFGCGDDDGGSTPMTDGGGDMDGGGGGGDMDGGGGGDMDGGGGGDTDGGGGGGGDDILFCQEECTMDADCTIGGSDAAGFTCESGRCVGSTSGCEMDAECVRQNSGWTLADSDGDFLPDAPCTADGVTPPATCADGEVCCTTGQLCVAGGACATAPSDFVMCSTLMQEEVMVAPVGGGDDVTVCAIPNAGDSVCEEGACRNPCNGDGDCASDAFPSCNMDSGACECTTDPADSCEASDAVAGTCMEGRCQCTADADCTVMGADTCYSGTCGCSDATVCPAMTTFDGTTQVCEGI